MHTRTNVVKQILRNLNKKRSGQENVNKYMWPGIYSGIQCWVNHQRNKVSGKQIYSIVVYNFTFKIPQNCYVCQKSNLFDACSSACTTLLSRNYTFVTFAKRVIHSTFAYSFVYTRNYTFVTKYWKDEYCCRSWEYIYKWQEFHIMVCACMHVWKIHSLRTDGGWLSNWCTICESWNS